MKYHAASPYMASFVIFRKSGKIAFLLRQNTSWMNGKYGLPAGKVEPGESATQAAIREAKEETGVSVKPQNLKHQLTVYRTGSTAEGDRPWIDIIFEAESWQGELHNAEPHKHGELIWLDPDNLPSNLTPYVNFFFAQITAGKHYAEYGWEE
jgi:8-oxo-dGTP pyrophosphatase MutT (NUDIX family)